MSETPNWNLLPGNPLKFFQLQRSCDQRALKRAYGKLIRQFKPERFPEEFKKIRAAYEQLQQEIEYGYWEQDLQTTPDDEIALDAKSESGSVDNSVESSDEPTIIQRADSAPMNVSVESSWKERIEKEQPEDLYAELETKTPKQPDDFLKLAILSDVVTEQPEPGEPSQFERWLLRGIEQSSDPHLLVQALSNYFEQLPEERFTDESQLVQFLLQLARLINTHRFFRVTSPLWFKLLREASLEIFQETLDRCEMILFDPNEQEKLIFYVQMLNAMQWKHDETRQVAYSYDLYQPEFDEINDWLNTKKEYLEAHYELLPFYNLDIVFDEADLIRLYHNSLGRFLNQEQTILRRRFHEMLRDYILNTPEVAQEKLIQFQLSVLQDDSEIRDCFSSSLEDEKNFLNLWTWMVNDCPGMHTEAETEPEKMKASTTQLLRQCDCVEIPKVNRKELSDFEPPSVPLSQSKLMKFFLSLFLINAFLYIVFIVIPQGDFLNGKTVLYVLISSFYLTTMCIVLGYSIFKACQVVIRFAWSETLPKSNLLSVKEPPPYHLYQKYLQPLWISFQANNHWHFESVLDMVKSEAAGKQSRNASLLLKFITIDTGALIVAMARRSLP